jgi:hypothetical protein
MRTANQALKSMLNMPDDGTINQRSSYMLEGILSSMSPYRVFCFQFMMDSTERSFANMRASTDGSSGVPSGSGLSSASRKSVSCVDLTPPDVRSKLGSNEFIVERVMSYKQIHKIRYARVKWLGYA